MSDIFWYMVLIFICVVILTCLACYPNIESPLDKTEWKVYHETRRVRWYYLPSTLEEREHRFTCRLARFDKEHGGVLVYDVAFHRSGDVAVIVAIYDFVDGQLRRTVVRRVSLVETPIYYGSGLWFFIQHYKSTKGMEAYG